MSGIPTTFDEHLPDYAVLGGYGAERRDLTAVLLAEESVSRRVNVPSRLKARPDKFALFEKLHKLNVPLIYIEVKSRLSDIKNLASMYPMVRFILLNEPISAGLQINLAAQELRNDNFLVLTSDTSIVKLPEALPKERALLSVPVFVNGEGKAAQFHTAPVFPDGKPRLLRSALTALEDGERVLFPYSAIGLYNRARFIQTGGFDGTITDEYWQLLDFSLRAWSWGEEIRVSNEVKLCLHAAPKAADPVTGYDYRKFFLKNLLPVFRTDAAYLPLKQFPRFCAAVSMSPFAAWEEFFPARAWVARNTYRWKRDIHKLLKEWRTPR